MNVINQRAIEEIKQMPDNAYPIVLTGDQAESFVKECAIMISLGDLAREILIRGDGGNRTIVTALTYQHERLEKILVELQDRL